MRMIIPVCMLPSLPFQETRSPMLKFDMETNAPALFIRRMRSAVILFSTINSLKDSPSRMGSNFLIVSAELFSSACHFLITVA